MDDEKSILIIDDYNIEKVMSNYIKFSKIPKTLLFFSSKNVAYDDVGDKIAQLRWLLHYMKYYIIHIDDDCDDVCTYLWNISSFNYQRRKKREMIKTVFFHAIALNGFVKVEGKLKWLLLSCRKTCALNVLLTIFFRLFR